MNPVSKKRKALSQLNPNVSHSEVEEAKTETKEKHDRSVRKKKAVSILIQFPITIIHFRFS